MIFIYLYTMLIKTLFNLMYKFRHVTGLTNKFLFLKILLNFKTKNNLHFLVKIKIYFKKQ